jgi:hypothetical protein
MTRLRLATYNVEWFNNLFDDHGRLLDDHGPSARYQVTRGEQLAALGIVFTALDADGILIIEAPDTNGKRSTVKALERFAATVGLRARKALIGFPSETEQEIAFLYDPDRLTVRHDPKGAATTATARPRRRALTPPSATTWMPTACPKPSAFPSHRWSFPSQPRTAPGCG